MNKLERVKAALACSAVDRPPYGFWTHLPGIDLDPRRLAEHTAAFSERYDLDFIKSMPNGLYCVEDWGCVSDYSEIERGGVARIVRPAITSLTDWDFLQHVEVTRGAYGRELEHLALLVQRVGGEVPVLATVFSPLTVAAKLSDGMSRAHLADVPERVLPAITVITEVTCALVNAVIARGCAGIFLAVQEATHGAYDSVSYRAYGEPYDQRVLEAAKRCGGWFNVLHMHGEDVLFDVLKDYDADALNWHIGETPPSLAEYRASGGSKPVLGGLQRGHMTRADRDAIGRDIENAVAGNGAHGLLLAPPCVIRHPVDDETLQWTAARIKSLARQA